MGHFKGKIGNAHARCHVTGWYGSSKTTYLESPTPICERMWMWMWMGHFHYITFMALQQRRLMGVYMGAPSL